MALAYFLFANLARLFAIPPDNFAPFFVPAGIALAVCVSYGPRLLPGVAVGALAFNLSWMLPVDMSANLRAMAAAFAVTAGSVVQAWLGSLLFARFAEKSLVSGRDIIAFLLLAPLSCLVAASMGTGSLVLLGVMAPENLLPNWLIWWLGDAVGVLLGAPLVWVLAGVPGAVWRRRRWTVGLPLVLSSCAFLALYAGVRHWEEDRQQSAFRLNSQQVSDLVQFQFDEHQRVLNIAVQAVTEIDSFAPERFARLAETYLRSRPELRLMSLARRVSAQDRAAFEAWARQHIAPDFSIRAIRPAEGAAAVADAPNSTQPDEYFTTVFIEPLAGNRRVMGLDLLSEPTRSDMVRRAMLDQKAMVASAPITLVQADALAPAILLARHIRLSPVPHTQSSDGVMVVVMEIEPYLGKTLARAGFADYTVHLAEVQSPSAVATSRGAVVRSRIFQRHLKLGDRSYLLTIEDPKAKRALTEWGSWAVLTFGLLLSAMVGAFLLLLSGQREQTEQFNRQLSVSLEKLTLTQRELVQSAKLASLGSMVAGLSHELNTPIGNCLLAASSMENKTLEVEQLVQTGNMKRSTMKAYLDESGQASSMLVRNLRHAANLITNFKQVAVNQHAEQIQRFNVSALVAQTTALLGAQFAENAITVTQDVGSGVELESYPAALGQVILSLLNNTLVHAFDGQDGNAVSIRAWRDGDRVKVSVSDNGRGIAPEHLEQIFDPFFTTRMAGGSFGLGLAIAHNMVTGILRGRLSVSSEIGHGSCFTVALPIHVSAYGEQNTP